jgi:hypothetical protein
MSTAEGSVVKEILNCIRAVCEKQRQLSSVAITQRERFIEETHETLEEVKINLCNLASMLVTAPISGRIFLPSPADYVSEETTMKSLCMQLGRTVASVNQ